VHENEENNESSDDEEYLYVTEEKKKPFKAFSTNMKTEEKQEEMKETEKVLKFGKITQEEN